MVAHGASRGCKGVQDRKPPKGATEAVEILSPALRAFQISHSKTHG